MQEEIVSLALHEALPVPIERQSGKGAAGREDSQEKENCGSRQQQQQPKRKAEAPVAPYQALPVTGAITHNFTPALPVLDQEDIGAEVRGRAAGAAAGGLQRGAGALPTD